MGQRTAIILQHENKYEYAKQRVTTRVFYHQWGIGRIMPSQFISILNGTLSTDACWDNFAERLKPQGCQDITDEYREAMGVLNSLNFNDPINVGQVLQAANNNNGGIFIRLTTDEYGGVEAVEYAYMLGDEEGGDYRHFCTAAEWMQKAGGHYIDNSFMAYYLQVLAYFEAVERCNGEAAKEKAA